jgi:hypothetical protein
VVETEKEVAEMKDAPTKRLLQLVHCCCKKKTYDVFLSSPTEIGIKKQCFFIFLRLWLLGTIQTWPNRPGRDA